MRALGGATKRISQVDASHAASRRHQSTAVPAQSRATDAEEDDLLRTDRRQPLAIGCKVSVQRLSTSGRPRRGLRAAPVPVSFRAIETFMSIVYGR